MILMDVEVYNNIRRLYEVFEALVDTGATFCVIAEHVTEKMGYVAGEKFHLWEVDSPLMLPKSTLRIKYGKKEHDVEAVIVKIREDYLRLSLPNEKCKRPVSPHPLTSRIILGKSFLDKLSESERKEILTYLA